MKMPEEFYTLMEKTLGEDYKPYATALNEQPFRGLRLNPLKAERTVLEKLPYSLQPSPFSRQGYYIHTGLTGVGNHPLHHAGAFYLQEPSAMSAATALEVQPGDRILDLCAAPGGKATQIAGELLHTGLIWANEIVPSRAQTLLSNFERLGVRAGVVSCERPDKLCSALSGYFDKVLVDAPCSGEGMLRREASAVREWRAENRAACARRQLLILDSAVKALREGGVLLYSTCTLSGEENEGVVEAFLRSHPECKLAEIGPVFGRPAYRRLAPGCAEIGMARRILPMDGGEGHFAARFIKTGRGEYTGKQYGYTAPPEAAIKFLKEHFTEEYGILQQAGDSILLMPEKLPETRGLRMLRAGVQAGKWIKGRIEPAHHLFSAARPNQCRSNLNLSAGDPRTAAYLRGEEISADDCRGYTCISIEGVALGFGKVSGGVCKNKYPKGLRLRNEALF